MDICAGREHRAALVLLVATAVSCGDPGTDGTETSPSGTISPTTTSPSTDAGSSDSNATAQTETDSGSGDSQTSGDTSGTQTDATTEEPTTDGPTTDGLTTDDPTTSTTDPTDSTDSSSDSGTETGGDCFDELPVPAGPEAVLAPEYVGTYVPYDLGPVPAPGDTVLPRLGGLVVDPLDPNTMYVVGPSEVPNAQLHRIGLERGECGHIVGFVGEAELVLEAPYLDLMANGPMDTVFISHYPTRDLSQYLTGANMLANTINTNIDPNQSAGGINFVPPGYPDEGMLRVMSFPINHMAPGEWHHADITHNGDYYDISPLTKVVEIPYGPGGFAYIPEGSPLFPEQRIMVTEWLSDPRGVSTYAVDDEGDPIPDTRKPFFESFVRPWGSYFEPETGDYMFLQWENNPDHIYIVQGFVPPPPIVE